MEKLGGGEFNTPGAGYEVVLKFGRNNSIATASTPVDIWPVSTLYPFPLAAQDIEIVSTSDEDKAGGLGALSIKIEGVDTDGIYQSEDIVPDGTNVVNLANQYLRINRAKVLTAGTDGSNVGTITIRVQGAGDILAVIALNADSGKGFGQTQQAIYTVPAGKKALIKFHYSRLDRFPSSDANLHILVREFGGAWQSKETFSISDVKSHNRPYLVGGIKVGERADIRVECYKVSANDTGIDAGFDIELEDLV